VAHRVSYMGTRRRGPQAVWLAGILGIWIAACQPRAEGGFASSQSLTAALRQAGATVEGTAIVAPPGFDARAARTLQVNQGLVYVYEYAGAEEAQAVAARLAPDGLSLSGTPLPWEGRVSAWQADRILVVYPGTEGGLVLLLNGLLGDPLTAQPEGPEEPYPPAIAAAMVAWAESKGLDPAGVEVIGYTAAEWLDGCLGLPTSGESCAPGAVRGWVVELRAGELSGSAHTDDLGLQVRLAPGD
jgi:hypothetical protein